MKKIVIYMIFIFAIIIGIQTHVEADSYKIEDMDIQATINQDGSADIIQKLTYDFNGTYNGIYIDIPYEIKDKEKEDSIKTDKLDDSLYTGSNIEIENITSNDYGIENSYKEVRYATNGDENVYTAEKKEGIYRIKVFSPTQNSKKTFILEYNIEDLAVQHNDVGELYYNFIGGKWQCEIEKLNIDIFLPENEGQLYIWGHGPYQGKSKIVDNTHANFQVENIKPGQYVATRLMFENSNIPDATKLSKVNAKDIILLNEQAIYENKKEKDAFTSKIILFATCLLIYWIILMLIFEKEKKHKVNNIDEEALFEKYNPMIAGCIQGSRDILARDIIAIILELINKKIINLELQPMLQGHDKYNYIISKNPKMENKMDSIEKYVYEWVFEGTNKTNYKERKKEKYESAFDFVSQNRLEDRKIKRVKLSKRLKDMPKEKEANKKFKELNDLVGENLKVKGANQAKVPFILRIFNIFLFILSIIFVYKNIMFNGLNIYSSKSQQDLLAIILYILIVGFPLIMGILYILINLIVMLRHKINKTVQKITGQKVVTTTISLIIFFGIIIILTAIFLPVKYIIADEILICIATILILTDNLMLKNSVTMIEDYSKLNTLKDKIENYSIMKDKDIEQIVLWEKYLSYAVSFGLAKKVIKRIDGLYMDDDLINLVKDEIFSDMLFSDYHLFYTYASLDRRFVKQYENTTKQIYNSLSSNIGTGSGSRKWRPEEAFLEVEDSQAEAEAEAGGGAF